MTVKADARGRAEDVPPLQADTGLGLADTERGSADAEHGRADVGRGLADTELGLTDTEHCLADAEHWRADDHPLTPSLIPQPPYAFLLLKEGEGKRKIVFKAGEMQTRRLGWWLKWLAG